MRNPKQITWLRRSIMASPRPGVRESIRGQVWGRFPTPPTFPRPVQRTNRTSHDVVSRWKPLLSSRSGCLLLQGLVQELAEFPAIHYFLLQEPARKGAQGVAPAGEELPDPRRRFLDDLPDLEVDFPGGLLAEQALAPAATLAVEEAGTVVLLVANAAEPAHAELHD